MNNIEFVDKLKGATKYKTLYVMGCFGAPLNSTNKKRYTTNHSYNKNIFRKLMINQASADTFGFDCVCLIKAILWGWCGDVNKTYGGATYSANGVPDIDADEMFSRCTKRSSDFNKIEVGEVVWCKGHIGVYIGDGLAIECTPKWKNGVQITACNRTIKGYNRRDWTGHGRLPYIQYEEIQPSVNPNITTKQKVSDTKMPQITVGSKGKAVKIWQAIVGVTIDGDFGANTKAATIAFQKKAFPNNKKEWDGIVGDKTWKAGLESV